MTMLLNPQRNQIYIVIFINFVQEWLNIVVLLTKIEGGIYYILV